jgi:hypothetical protein
MNNEKIIPDLLVHKRSVCFPYLLILIILFIMFQNVLLGQESALYSKWSSNTAVLMPKGKWESGIFQSFRYGINDKIELRSNALIFPVFPSAGMKVSLGGKNGYIFASEHAVSYPSLFLDLISFKGTGGLISPQYEFPFILSVSNSLIISKHIGSSSIISIDAGIDLALRTSKPDYQATIDLPLIYPRMAHYYEGISINGSVSFKGTISKEFFYEENARLFIITRENDNLFAENNGMIMWVAGKSFRLKGGYSLSWGRYPFGNHFQLWPLIGMVFGSRK